eukprot:COSAG06_NODE_46584_length_345_cov_89.967480_1_plen_51_part_10
MQHLRASRFTAHDDRHHQNLSAGRPILKVVAPFLGRSWPSVGATDGGKVGR